MAIRGKHVPAMGKSQHNGPKEEKCLARTRVIRADKQGKCRKTERGYEEATQVGPADKRAAMSWGATAGFAGG